MYGVLNANVCGIEIGDFEAYAKAAAQAGFQGVDMPDGCFGSEGKARDMGALLRAHGLRWGMFHTPGELLSEEMDDAGFARALEELKALAQCAQAAGCDRTYSNLWSGSNTMAYTRHEEWVQNRLAQVNGALKAQGVRYGVEALGPKTLQDTFRHPFIRRLDDAIALLDTVDASMGFVFDTFHWYCMGAEEAMIDLAARQADRMLVLHVNDAMPGVPIEQQMDLQRGMPMEHGVIDSVSICKRLTAGYDGPVTIEALNPWAERLAAVPMQQAVARMGDAWADFTRRLEQ